MKLQTLHILALALAASLGAPAANAQDARNGEAVFQLMCAPCHAAGAGDDGRTMLPGTAALQIKYQGSMPAVLEQRSDLTPEVLAVFLRRGSMSMPPFRKTELSDFEIADIAAYIAETAAAD
jgi:mono/diheme cytochrome c family protein